MMWDRRVGLKVEFEHGLWVGAGDVGGCGVHVGVQ